MAYCDLKPENIVIERYKNEKETKTLVRPCYKIKLVDIGSIQIIFTDKKDLRP